MLQSFQHYIESNHLFLKKDKLLVAVSGGVDSIVLCDLLQKCGYTFAIAHCNFQLRKEESDGDEVFVKLIAERFQRQFFIKKFDTNLYAEANKVSTQVAARELRYQWFAQLIERGEANMLLTAHHASDNIETLLMNFFKGTGIKGLQGILPKTKNKITIVRPFLFAQKAALLHYANENKQHFREDSSNASDKYTRNYFRNKLLPAIQRVYPGAEANLLHNLQRFNDVAILYNMQIEEIKRKLITVNNEETHIPVLRLLKTPAMPTVLFEIVKNYGFAATQLPEIIKLLDAESGKFISNERYRILKNRKWLIISQLSNASAVYIINEGDSELFLEDKVLHITTQELKGEINQSPDFAFLDKKEIDFPLILRKWKQGDYFYPLGMSKKKKLSRFFVDNKLSLLQKENTWVLESNKKIIWVLGMRIDNRFKITGATKQVLRLKLQHSS
ncbi:MAG: tRNA lysidine(34) synthetase TilS [Chitinophagaceae bacterium]|nr:tRNA lysidine(34) synthetase TilS [Chitinophagaceae bacterium]